MFRRLSLVALLTLSVLVPSAIAQSVPDRPLYTATLTLAPGEERTIEDVFTANTSCDSVATRYTLVVTNGNPDGSGMVESGAAGVNGLDYVDDALADGVPLLEVDAPLQSVNVAVMRAKAPPTAAAVLTMEIRRRPITVTNHHQSYAFPQSATNKNYTVSFTVADPSLPAMLIVTRNGGLQTSDQFFLKLNNVNWFSRTNFSATSQTLTAFVPLLASNTLKLDAVAASQASDVVVRIVQHGPDTTHPALALIGTIPAKVSTNTYTFSGTVSDANRIASLKMNDANVSFNSGTGSFTKPVTLAHGAPNEFTFLAYDCAGHGTQIVKTIEWDRDAPSVVVTSPAANAFVKGALTVSGTATDDTSGNPVVTVNGTAATWNGAMWSANVTLAAPDGAKTITVVATDSLQRATTVVVPVSRDATLPTISAAIAPPKSANGWNARYAVVSFTCADAVSGIATCTEPITLDQMGIYVVSGKAVDVAGNEKSLTYPVRVDNEPPDLTINGAFAVVNQSPLLLDGMVFDSESGAAGLTFNGVPATLNGEGFTFSQPLQPGVNVITAVAVDAVGLEDREIFEVKLDQQAPQLTILEPQDGAQVAGPTVEVRGTAADDDEIFTVKVNGNVTTDFANGEFTHTVTLAASGVNTIAVEAKDRGGNITTQTVTVSVDDTPPTITAEATPQPNAEGWNGGPVTVTFTCDDAGGSGVATCSDPQTIIDSGTHTVTGTATDNAGNQATTTITVKVDAVAPAVTLDATAPVVNQSTLALAGSVSDTHSGILGVRCGEVDATLNGARFSCTVSLLPGSNAVTVIATDRAGYAQQAAVEVQLDERAPLLEITEPADGTIINGTQVVVKGTASDNDAIATVRVNGTIVTVNESGEFTRQLTLVPGDNVITVETRDRGGNLTTRAITVNRYIVPVVTITSPRDLAVLRDTTVTITGTVSDPAAAVMVNDIVASVASNGSFTAAGVPLQQGRTVITANAISPSGGTATTSINLYRDSIPPRLEVYSPENGATVFASPVSISGMVDDIVVGTINSQQMRVKVNSADAEVANRAFLMRNVALLPGLNTFSISAIDEGGNTTVVSYSLTYVPAPPQPHLEIVSGDGQTGKIGTALAAPLVVRAVAPDGSAIAGATLTFEMDNNDGTLSDGTTTASRVIIVTDPQGRAQAQWTLGNRAGAGNHRVRIHATGYAAPLEATAAATTGDPHLIVVDSGNNQFGIANDALPRPLVAIVVDAGNNRLANVPVTFTVAVGGGTFDGQPSLTVATDSDGRAVARPTLGPETGEDNNVFTASLTGVSSTSTFVASGRAAGPPAATTITGVVMDNSSIPLAGVSVRVDGTQLYTQTDENGQFTLANAPVGYVKLFVDGSTTQRPGTWPTLEYALYTLPGVENSVGMPIYLVQLDTSRGLFVDDTTGGTLTLPELPGFALEVNAGSATFPGGGRTGTVSATLVHADRIPMAPGFGQQPKFIITIQPPGTHFDPPARLTLPNTDSLIPGASTEMYSFDHDLGQFITIGSATVSADGSVITSDPGTGIIKGGWHAGGDPTPGGGGGDCGECSLIVNEACAADPLMEGGACSDDGIPCTFDWCVNGVQTHREANFRIELESPEDDFKIQSEPRMPVIRARAVITNIPENVRGQVRYLWRAEIRYQTPRNHGLQTVEIEEVEAGSTWTPEFPFIQGGQLTIYARLLRNGRRCKEEEATHEILGVNPARATVIVRINSKFLDADFQKASRQMACRESGMMQFQEHDNTNQRGHPTYGWDRNGRTLGVGLKQLTDPPAQRHTWWHWVNNLDEGVLRFVRKYNEGVGYSNRKHTQENAPLLTAEQLLLEGMQRYNTGAYWKWRNGRWVADPRNPNGTVNTYIYDVQHTTHCGDTAPTQESEQ